jgi:copper homeostasis protein
MISTLEVIASSIEDIKIINKSQADRIELCIDLDKGGYTPDLATVKQAISISIKPIMVMLRYQEEFVLSDMCFQKIINNLKIIKTFNPHGFVFGSINKDASLNKKQIKIIKKLCDGFEVTFHKAIDFSLEYRDNILFLEQLGIKNVLTQGGINPVLDNLNTLFLIKNKLSTLNILIGGGVDKSNINILCEKGFNNIHIGTAARASKN